MRVCENGCLHLACDVLSVSRDNAAALFHRRQGAQPSRRVIGRVCHKGDARHLRVSAILLYEGCDIHGLQYLLVRGSRFIDPVPYDLHIRLRLLDGQHGNLLFRVDFLFGQDEI